MFASALPEPAGLSGTERNSAGLDRAEAPERVAVRRQHLSFRSPLSYFHNGLAATLEDVVALYQASLGFVFTRQEAADLVAFLQAL
jgi:cytochrome c peroxidase